MSYTIMTTSHFSNILEKSGITHCLWTNIKENGRMTLCLNFRTGAGPFLLKMENGESLSDTLNLLLEYYL